jgi:Mg2+-importing ATPase
MIITPVTCAVIGAVLPFTPLAGVLGFTALPLSFFLILIGMIVTYLVLVELAKTRFYGTDAHPRRAPLTHEQRHQRHVARRAGRFTHHLTTAADLSPGRPTTT